MWKNIAEKNETFNGKEYYRFFSSVWDQTKLFKYRSYSWNEKYLVKVARSNESFCRDLSGCNAGF